jgi:hypothetical protein
LSHSENVFGLPVQIKSTAEVLNESAPLIYAVSRCTDLPQRDIPPQIRIRNRTTPCDNCREICWYDPKYAIAGARVLCLHCLPPDTELNAQREQVDEVRQIYPWA